MTDNVDYYHFYSTDNQERMHLYSTNKDVTQHCLYPVLTEFIEKFNLRTAKILEVGSGVGLFQHVVKDYHGVDVAESLSQFYENRMSYSVIKDNCSYPFPDHTFDAIFTFNVLEHIPSLTFALEELLRVTKPNGYLLIQAAWQVRPWASEGLDVRPYSDLTLRQKLSKATIKIRESVLWRSLFIFPKRLLRTIRFLMQRKNSTMWQLDYKKLSPNYDVFWQADSDACNHIDIHALIIWFMSKNCSVITYPSLKSAFFARTGYFIVKKNG
ncbi:class I SAM-dependent methyltransferase [Beggiatoa leptomitoformis]|uniref:Methyltransferase domain-containing protein n=1 Tax=Beggiatoa leptomitoformis TaxID=288004 RepID=A0A2N9YEN9_9GAMM|nr:class I SAM-dependent methyltransferase [Beggiatoa leptomitoformis]ALG68711.1 methyltransferase domain-containing protein [Beggiatoa leptomitoformis]AUI68934.1 methyltransferase domain-containing protein [Beggiatoa leptomitoformis]